MNTTFKVSQNSAAYSMVMCRVVEAIVQAVFPGYPSFQKWPMDATPPDGWSWPTDHWC
jgi:hypothetical protein